MTLRCKTCVMKKKNTGRKIRIQKIDLNPMRRSASLLLLWLFATLLAVAAASTIITAGQTLEENVLVGVYRYYDINLPKR